MSTVLAALDTTAAARPVLETALGIGRLTAASVEAVHVAGAGPLDTPQELATRSGVPLRILAGPVVPALLRAIAAPEVVAAVVGARATPAGRRPAGGTALAVVAGTDKPVVVVPPEAIGGSPRRYRLVVPLEGDAASSAALLDGLIPLLTGDVELVVLHVFTPRTAPRFLDRPVRDLPLLGEEFLARHCPPGSRVELRTGSVAAGIHQLCRDESADLIVLSWSQTMGPGRAAVVMEVLGRAKVPVLLLPAEGTG